MEGFLRLSYVFFNFCFGCLNFCWKYAAMSLVFLWHRFQWCFFFGVGRGIRIITTKTKMWRNDFRITIKNAKQEWLLQLFTAKAAQLNEPIKVALIASNRAPGKHNWFWFVRWLVEWFSNDCRKWFLWFWVYLVLSLSLKIVITIPNRNKRGVGVGFQS